MTTPERRAAHPFHMYDAILAQPAAIGRLLIVEEEAAERAAALVRDARRVHVVGIGTSWHAALVGEWWLRALGGRDDARAWNSFEFRTDGPPLNADDAVIVMGHRGTKRFSTASLQMARERKAKTIAITGIGSATGDGDADVVIRTAPVEQSAAFTVSHGTALTALAMIAVAVGASLRHKPALLARPGLAQLHVLMEWAIATELGVRKLAAATREAAFFALAGAGPNASTAMEGALKLNEAAYPFAAGYQTEQLLHGPFVALGPSTVVVALMTPGDTRDRTIQLLRAADAIGAHTVAVTQEDDHHAPRIARTVIQMPEVPVALTPVTFLGPLQLLAYWLAVERGHNPDVFRLDDPAHLRAREFYAL